MVPHIFFIPGSLLTAPLVQGTLIMKTKIQAKMREGVEEDTYWDESMTLH